MFLNLSTMRTELINRLKSSSAILSSTRLNQWINQSQEDVSNEFDFNNLLIDRSITASITSRKNYIQEVAYNKIRSVVISDQDYVLEQTSKERILYTDPSETDTGVPYLYAVEGYGYIRATHSSGTVTVVSSSASDTAVKVRIRGNTTNNIIRTELLTLNGTTNVTGTITYTEVYSAVLDSAAVGTVTATVNDASSTVIARIAPSYKIDENVILYLYPLPTTAHTVNIRGYRRPREMIQDEDFPDFPTNYHELVMLGAMIRGNKDLFRFNIANDIMQNEFVPRLRQLRKDQGFKSTISPVLLGQPQPVTTIGRLPANYPRD